MSIRFRQAALLVLLAILAAVGVSTLPAGTPLRVLAGLVLALALPWLAASRLAAIRESDVEGGRISSSGALALASTILLGLVLSMSAAGIERPGVTVGLVAVIAVLAVLGVPGSAAIRLPDRRGRDLLALALTAVAVAVAVAAFALARDRALTQAHEETAYAAFLFEAGDRFDVGLSNSSDRPARFTIREVGEEGGRAATVTVPAKDTGVVRGFLRRPPALRPIEQVRPSPAAPEKVRVIVRVGGRRAGPALNLSTYAP